VLYQDLLYHKIRKFFSEVQNIFRQYSATTGQEAPIYCKSNLFHQAVMRGMKQQ